MDSELLGENRNGVMERAKEELEMLEFQHPNKFHSLKMELEAFIHDFQSHNLLLNSTNSISAATQESSSRKKRKKDGFVVVEEVEIEASFGKDFIKRRCKTDAVLERAQQCLYKIPHLKTSFYITS